MPLESLLSAAFVRSDVACVSLLAAVPLAVILTTATRGWSRAARCLAGGLLLIAGTAAASLGGEFDGFLLRPLISALLVAGPGLILAGVRRQQVGSCQPGRIGTTVLAFAVLAILPTVYVDARTRHDLQSLTDLLEQSRLGEALALADEIQRLQPSAAWRNQPIEPLRGDLRRAVADLRLQVAVPLPASADLSQQTGRARQFAMLGDTAAALQILNATDASLNRPAETLNLLGTICETRSEWRAAALWYSRARDAAKRLAPEPAQQGELATALRGIGYAARKCGRTREAEAAYLDLLAIAPTADTHFLLAQFYEDAQHSDLARRHLEDAERLDPRRYAADGARLLNRLTTTHFGCLGVYFAGRNAPPSGRPAD